MSLDLSALMSKTMTKHLLLSVSDFLVENGFYQDEDAYRSGADGIFVDVYIDQKPEEDDYWGDGEAEAIGFFPKAVISMESRHTELSHRENYRLTKELAKIVEGVIYDHQVAVVYDAERQPYSHYRTKNKLEDYGAGMELFMRAVSVTKEILNAKERQKTISLIEDKKSLEIRIKRNERVQHKFRV